MNCVVLEAACELRPSIARPAMAAQLRLLGLVVGATPSDPEAQQRWTAATAVTNMPSVGIRPTELGDDAVDRPSAARAISAARPVLKLDHFAPRRIGDSADLPVSADCPWPEGASRCVVLLPCVRPARGRHEGFCGVLADWCANAHRAPAPHPAESDAACLARFGAEAYELPAAHRTIDSSPLVPTVEDWLSARRLDLEYLVRRAGRAGTRLGRRLRRAADAIEMEVRDGLEPARQACLVGSREAARRALARAGALHAEAAHHLVDGLCIALRSDPRLHAALLEPDGYPLEGMGLREVVYLARAGAPAYRALAASRLAGSGDSQAIATLRQLLHDADARVVAAALRSCCARPDRLGNVLANCYRHDPPTMAHALMPRPCSILLAARDLPSGEWNAVRAAVQADERDDPMWAGVRNWARPLLG